MGGGGLCVGRGGECRCPTGAEVYRGAANLSQVVVSVFHFRTVNTLPASISLHFWKFSARQLS